MKPLIITAFVLVVGIAGVGTYLNQPVEVMNERVDAGMATTTEEVTPEWMTDEDAIKAAEEVIKRKKLEAREQELVDEIVTRQEELDEIRKELGTY